MLLVDCVTHLIEKPYYPFKVHTMKESGLNRKDDGGSFGAGDTVVHSEMTGQGGGKVRHSNGGVMGTELTEKEVERHRFVGDRGLDGWSDKGLDRDGKGAVANADHGSVLRGGRGAVRVVDGGSNGGGVGLSLIRWRHEPTQTVALQ
jgi:hypothetical protein